VRRCGGLCDSDGLLMAPPQVLVAFKPLLSHSQRLDKCMSERHVSA